MGWRAPSHPRVAPGRAHILILTTFDLDEYVYSALRAGASGFLLKDTLAADLLAAIRMVAKGDAIAAPSITRRLIERHIGTSGDPLPRTRPSFASSPSENARCSN